MRWTRPLLVGLATLAALTLLAAGAHGQTTATGDTLSGNSPVAFQGATDTYVEETNEDPAEDRRTDPQVALRGEGTQAALDDTQGQGERAYLLALSPSGGAGIPGEVQDRYDHGNLTQANLVITYNGGCQSPDGQLTVLAIDTRAWDPATVTWDKTNLDGDDESTVDVLGPTLATQAINPDAAGNDPDVSCQEATIQLNLAHVKDVLTGDRGGLLLRWQGIQPLTLNTLDASSGAPKLEVELQTRSATVHNVTLDDGIPSVIEPNTGLTIQINATDERALPTGAVKVRVIDHEDRTEVDNLTAEEDGDLFSATKAFSPGTEGLFDVVAVVEDSDGWRTVGHPATPGPHIAVDTSPPRIPEAALGGQAPGQTATGDQGTNLSLAFETEDLACQAKATPCATYQATWQGLTLAQGTVGPDGSTEVNLTLTKPGTGQLTLEVSDVLGHTNTSTTWPLEVEDTHRPEPVPLGGTLLAPSQTSTVEEGTPVPVALNVGDDLPVTARMRLARDGGQITKDLPAPDEDGTIEGDLTDLPVGDHEATLIVDDGTHTVQLAWGQLRVAEEGAPTVLVALPGPRIQPTDALIVQVRDQSLDEEATRVTATIDSVQVTPEVTTQAVTGGLDLTVTAPGLVHGDRFELEVQASDDLGRTSRGGAAVTIDAKGPLLTAPRNGTWYAPSDPITLKAQDPGQGTPSIQAQGGAGTVGGDAPLTVTASQVLPTSGTGMTNLTLLLTDDLGNQRADLRTLGIDVHPPTLAASVGEDGIVLNVRDNGSGIAEVSAQLFQDGLRLNTTLVREDPGRYVLKGPELSRGEMVDLVAHATDAVGNRQALGTVDQPRTITVPDRPPTLTLDRLSEIIATEGRIQWSAEDPDGDQLNLTLELAGPQGTLLAPTEVAPSGQRTFTSQEPGRYTAKLTVEAGGHTIERATVLYLSPDGRISQVDSAPDRIEPGEPVEIELSFPSAPQSVHVVAKDAENVTTPAEVTLSGTSATARFDALPAGSYTIEATVLHEPGVSESFTVASVDAKTGLGSALTDLLLPLLILVALIVLGVVVYVIAQRGDEGDEP